MASAAPPRCRQVVVNGLPMEFISALDHPTSTGDPASDEPPGEPQARRGASESPERSRKRQPDQELDHESDSDVRSDIRPVRILVVIPGNPGSAAFYKRFSEQLAAKLSWDAHHTFEDVLVWSYAGFTTISPPASPYSIDREAEHLREFLEHVRRDLQTPVDFWLVGHSIGSYLALDLLATFPAVTNAILLFPFLVIDDKARSLGKQTVLRTLINTPLVHNTLARGFSLLPRRVKRALVNAVAGPLSPEARETAQQCFAGSNDLLFSVTYMAMTEFRTLPVGMAGLRERYVPFLRENRHRIHALYAPNDIWAPMWQADVLEFDAGLSVNRFDEKSGVSHAFCTSEKQTDEVRRAVVRSVRSMESCDRPAKRFKGEHFDL